MSRGRESVGRLWLPSLRIVPLAILSTFCYIRSLDLALVSFVPYLQLGLTNIMG